MLVLLEAGASESHSMLVTEAALLIVQVSWLSVELLLRRDQLRKVILKHPNVSM